ncbi:hypothetical protein F4802DRAFT_592279 [Xylaria palmicola]|nr:hypothetical protein F4802DRAFT_592279 [Xylaria palmicola]
MVAIFQILWFIPNFIERLLICNPPAKLWDRTIKGFCVDSQLFIAITESFNTLIDFVMIGMAIWMVVKLRISTKNKIKLSLIFAVGGFSGIVGIIKIIQVYGKVGKNGTDLPWLLAQMSTSVICCSVPLHRSILPEFHILSSLRSTFFSSHDNGSHQKNIKDVGIPSLQTIGQISSNGNSNRSWPEEETLPRGGSSSARQLTTRGSADSESVLTTEDPRA